MKSQTTRFEARLGRAGLLVAGSVALASVLLSACSEPISAVEGKPPSAVGAGTAGAGAVTGQTPSATSAVPMGMTPVSTPSTPAMSAGMQPSGMPDMTAMVPAPSADPVMNTPPGGQPPAMPTGTPTLFWLDILGGGVYRAPADDPSKAMMIASSRMAPDGIAVDVEGGKVYWTNMGNVNGGGGNASVQRAGLDGSNVETVIAEGTMGFNTGKQLTMDTANKKLYFADREGTTIWRSDYDGKNMEPLVRRSSSPNHDFVALVGIAVDVPNKQFYFTDKDARKIRRASTELKDGETPETRAVEELEVSGNGSGPIDLHLDLNKRLMYWTDRYLATVQVAGMDLPAGKTAADRDDIEVLQMGVTEAIGITLDESTSTAYVTQVNGTVSKFSLDGGMRTVIGRNGSTGIAFVRIP